VALGLARRQAGPEATAALDRIERETERLNELIGNLLQLSRLESGAAPMGAETVELDGLVREVAEDANFEAQSRNRKVRVIEAESCAIAGSRELVRSAVENVVRNALKYTAEGTDVEVSVKCMSDPAGENGVIRIRDHGEGVPEDALEDIFRPFYRVADSRERSSGGTGLGLTITERAMRVHGGQVKAQNSPAGGLVVELRLPVIHHRNGTT
jgi:signal transduction histidine kinase